MARRESHRTPPAKIGFGRRVSDHTNFFQQDLDGGDRIRFWTVSMRRFARVFQGSGVSQGSGTLVFLTDLDLVFRWIPDLVGFSVNLDLVFLLDLDLSLVFPTDFGS